MIELTEEEILRQRYISLQKKLYRVRNKVRESIGDYNDIFSLIKSGILIDGEVYGYDDLEKVKRRLNLINNDLTNTVIPKVNNKI